MIDEKREVPYIIYSYLHFKLYNQTNGSHSMKLKDAVNFLSNWRIPKFLRRIIIKELELLGKVEKINRNVIEVKKPLINIDNPKEIFNIFGENEEIGLNEGE